MNYNKKQIEPLLIFMHLHLERKRLARTILIFIDRSDQFSRATDYISSLPASPGYVQ